MQAEPGGVVTMSVNDDKNRVGDQVLAELEAEGFRAALIPFSCIEEITRAYNEYVENENSPFLIKEWFHSGQPPDLPFTPLSFLVIAFQSPGGEMSLICDGKEIALPIPPTYLDGSTTRRLNDVLANAVKDRQLAEVKAISLKMLSVLSGLGKYGRNALCYLDGYGSFCNFAAYYTDIPCDNEPHELALMDDCESCGLCIANCPNNALGGPLKVDAPRCLTLWNEHDGPMPDWLTPDVHHTVVGCMRCQEICPVNKAAPKIRKEALKLSGTETTTLMTSAAADLPAELVKKLLDYDLWEMVTSLAGRNLALAMNSVRMNGKVWDEPRYDA